MDALEVELVILGSGTSHGVPMIACECPVCVSPDPRDRRTRASALVTMGGRNVLIDTSPELRLQCLAQGVRRVDAVLFTHAHADHLAGMDDLRRFTDLTRAPLDCYADAATAASIRRMFAYIFDDDPEYPSTKPRLRLHEIDDRPFDLWGATVTPVPIMHGELPILGFRFGSMAYCTDCSRVPDASRERLRDLDVLILDGLRRRPHPTHFNLEQAIEEARRIGARRTYFTHIAHELGHAATNAELPAGMELAYDGLTVGSG
jgi:phosphoribosyl 1,2-cyclic phosphate phosphodiesterase